jgi:hypothetical protein
VELALNQAMAAWKNPWLSSRLKESMALILGDNPPASIELTSITSDYGAYAQEFHHDG